MISPTYLCKGGHQNMHKNVLRTHTRCTLQTDILFPKGKIMSSILSLSQTDRQTDREKWKKLTRRRRFLAGCPVMSEHPSPFFESWTAAVESWQQTTFNTQKTPLQSTENHHIMLYIVYSWRHDATVVHFEQRGSCRFSSRNRHGCTRKWKAVPQSRTLAADGSPESKRDRSARRDRVTVSDTRLWSSVTSIINRWMWTQDIRPHLVIPAAQAELTAHAAGRGAVVFTDAVLENTKPHGAIRDRRFIIQ